MKKFFTLIAAALVSVSMFASRDVVPGDPVLAEYCQSFDVCVCIYVPADLDCYDKVLTGSFNNWSLTNCPVFQEVEGYDGWYVASFEAEAEPDENKGMQAMPVIKTASGAISRNYQAGAVTLIRGGVMVQQGAAAGEIELTSYGADAPNVYIVDAWKNNPCTEMPPVTYTLQLVVSDSTMGSVAVTNLLGSDIIDNQDGTYTVPELAQVTILATPNDGYQFAGWKEGNVGELNCYYCGVDINTENNPMTITMTSDKAIKATFEEAVERELAKIGVNFPTADCPADDKIQMAGTFAEGTMTMEKIVATGWFVSYDFVNAAADDTFKFRDATNNDKVLCKYIPANGDAEGKWVQAIFKFGNYWQADSWKGTPCKLIEEDLSDANQYAWKVGMPEPDPEESAIENISGSTKAVKRIVNGQLVIEHNGKFYNALGAEVK